MKCPKCKNKKSKIWAYPIIDGYDNATLYQCDVCHTVFVE